MTRRPRVLAFHLPQFHPIPENDEWWGAGFTEWRNVARARPLFRGHEQPHEPAELGQYDLRVPQARSAQAELARAHGIDAFCYYHYWFHGRRVLERPFDEILASGEPDFPFCLCWANEPWTRSWDGRSGTVLLEQRYGPEDDVAHADWLCRAFADRRYLRVDGKPLFLVYRASSLPEPRRTTDRWRERCRERGIGELHLARVDSFPEESAVAPADQGFDAAVEFQPDWGTLVRHRWWLRLRSLLLPGRAVRIRRTIHAYDYSTIVDLMLRREPPGYPRYPCVVPGWDNTPRRVDGAYMLVDRSPEEYARWLADAMRRAASVPGEPLVFVNAWNEWGEGCHLEPCARFGRAFLEATRAVVAEYGSE